MDQYNELFEIVTNLKADIDKFYNKGNQSAGKRIRKVCQNIKKAAQNLRIDTFPKIEA